MRERWFLPTVASLSLSIIAIAGVVLLAFVSCATPAAVETPGPSGANQEPAEAMASLRDLQTSFNFIGDTVASSVVRIDVRERVTQNGPQLGLPFFDYFFGQPDDEEPQDEGFERGGVGSGVIVSSDRGRYYVLTNEHVVGEADVITVILNDGTELEAELIGRDPRKDLAMVSIPNERELPVARLGDSDSLRVGDWVVAIGSPFGYQNTITAGIVSAVDRRGGPDGNISDFIQTDASINQGNSGGALVNLDGEVVGINTWITSDSGGSIGLGFAIPINNVRRSITEFLADGEVEYGWLGVSIQTVGNDQVENLNLPGRFGALVDSVFANSPADEAGLLPGDFVYEIDGQPITDSDDLILLIGDLPIGVAVEFSLMRLGELLSVPIALAARESDAAIVRQSRLRWPGFSVYPLTDEIAESAGLDTSGGVIISVVDDDSPASMGGLMKLDVVTSINGMAVDDLLSFYRIIADPDLKEWHFSALRDGNEIEVTVVR
jgi:Do/DeqQ family serine protease